MAFVAEQKTQSAVESTLSVQAIAVNETKSSSHDISISHDEAGQEQKQQLVTQTSTDGIELPNLDDVPEPKYTDLEAKDKSKCWLATELTLHDFDIKQQSFEISGWINVFWKWEHAPAKLSEWDGNEKLSNDALAEKRSKIIIYKDNNGHDIVKVLDLRGSGLSYYLPIDAEKIFYQPSLLANKHIDPPCLYYNKQTKQAHSQYYINSTLSEQLELFLFPFDRQFLNIKLRWNVDYYRILHYQSERDVPLKDNWWGQKGSKSCDRQIELFHDDPVKISLLESIKNEVTMMPAWINFQVAKAAQSAPYHKNNKKTNAANLRFALIRMRINRKPAFIITNILFPFLMIVSCSFSIFAIDYENVQERLGVSVTILLTFTAFQSIIADELPQTSAMLLIDWYICLAYLLQLLLVVCTSLVSVLLRMEVDIDTVRAVDWVFGGILCVFWVLFSLFYLSLKYETFLNLCDRCCGFSATFNDWERRGQEEIDEWQHNNESVSFERLDGKIMSPHTRSSSSRKI